MKLNKLLSQDPASSLPRYLPKENEGIFPCKNLCANVYSLYSLYFYNHAYWKHPSCPSDGEWKHPSCPSDGEWGHKL
jgi:hypothetical protein